MSEAPAFAFDAQAVVDATDDVVGDAVHEGRVEGLRTEGGSDGLGVVG
jgi:hypothetical protein